MADLAIRSSHDSTLPAPLYPPGPRAHVDKVTFDPPSYQTEVQPTLSLPSIHPLDPAPSSDNDPDLDPLLRPIPHYLFPLSTLHFFQKVTFLNQPLQPAHLTFIHSILSSLFILLGVSSIQRKREWVAVHPPQPAPNSPDPPPVIPDPLPLLAKHPHFRYMQSACQSLFSSSLHLEPPLPPPENLPKEGILWDYCQVLLKSPIPEDKDQIIPDHLKPLLHLLTHPSNSLILFPQDRVSTIKRLKDSLDSVRKSSSLRAPHRNLLQALLGLSLFWLNLEEGEILRGIPCSAESMKLQWTSLVIRRSQYPVLDAMHQMMGYFSNDLTGKIIESLNDLLGSHILPYMDILKGDKINNAPSEEVQHYTLFPYPFTHHDPSTYISFTSAMANLMLFTRSSQTFLDHRSRITLCESLQKTQSMIYQDALVLREHTQPPPKSHWWSRGKKSSKRPLFPFHSDDSTNPLFPLCHHLSSSITSIKPSRIGPFVQWASKWYIFIKLKLIMSTTQRGKERLRSSWWSTLEGAIRWHVTLAAAAQADHHRHLPPSSKGGWVAQTKLMAKAIIIMKNSDFTLPISVNSEGSLHHLLKGLSRPEGALPFRMVWAKGYKATRLRLRRFFHTLRHLPLNANKKYDRWVRFCHAKTTALENDLLRWLIRHLRRGMLDPRDVGDFFWPKYNQIKLYNDALGWVTRKEDKVTDPPERKSLDESPHKPH